MHRLARFSVAYPTTVLMVVLAIFLLGYISFQRLEVDLFPDLRNPRLFVEVFAGERPPEEMERQFVAQLEAIAARGRGVENVASTARTGTALITVEYGWQVDMDEAFLDLQKAVADAAQRSKADEISVSQHDPNSLPVLVAAFSHPEIDDLDILRQTAETVIRNELIRLPGVAAVELVGVRRRQVEIRTDVHRLAAYGLTLGQLSTAIQAANRSMTGGSLVEMGRRYVIRGVGEFTSVDEIADLIVTHKTPPPGSAAGRVPIHLRDVARVDLVLDEPENIVRLDGRRCLGLEIHKEARVNTIDAVESIDRQLSALRNMLPGYEIEVIRDQSRFIQAAVSEVEETGLLGILLAVGVLYVFLRRLGVTAVIGAAIPISIVATFNLMYFNDLSLNIMTLGGLALGAGMLVDNAIVVVENIFRHLEEGESLTEAAVNGTAEVGGAITSATLTTIVVFLPIVYLHGAAGELFREQAWTVAFSLLSSLFVALLVIPMLCSRLLGSGRRSATADESAGTVPFPRYTRFLAFLLRHRPAVLMSAVLLMAGTLWLLPTLGSEFMPRAAARELTLQLALPEGTSLERTEGAVRNLETFATRNFGDHLHHTYARVGRASGSAAERQTLTGENSASLHLLLDPQSALPVAALVTALDAQLEGLPGAEARFLLQETALETSLGRTAAPLQVEVRGKDLETLADLASRIAGRLEDLEELTSVESGLEAGRPEIDIVVDRAAAARQALSVDAISTQLQALLSGREAGQFEHRGEYADILVRHPDFSVDELAGIQLETSAGTRVRLADVARLVPAVAPQAISRRNQTRVATVSAHLATDRPFDQVAATVGHTLAGIDLPPEYGLTIVGEELMRQEAFANLRFALLLSLALVYMVMAAQFESLLHPFVILLTVPLAGVGAVLLLLALGMPLNVMSFIGIIVLAGIAVNDSIVLIDRINQSRRAGMELSQAVIHAVQTRIRPIVMTSVTTILALLPLTLGIGQSATLRAPMAAAVIGGLFTSTVLTLAVIPCLYHLLARFDRLAARPSRES